MKGTVTAIACSGILAISLAGCGSDDANADKSSTLSATAFKKEANALCRTANAEIAAIQKDLASATTADAANAVNQTLTERIDKLAASIEDLNEPRDLADGVGAMLAEVSKVVTAMKSQGLDYYQNAPADPFQAADAKAREIGLPDCAGDN